MMACEVGIGLRRLYNIDTGACSICNDSQERMHTQSLV